MFLGFLSKKKYTDMRFNKSAIMKKTKNELRSFASVSSFRKKYIGTSWCAQTSDGCNTPCLKLI